MYNPLLMAHIEDGRSQRRQSNQGRPDQRSSHPVLWKRRQVLRLFGLGATAVTIGTEAAGCGLKELPGEVIEGGTILETKEDFMTFIRLKQMEDKKIVVNPDTKQLDEDSATIIKSAAYLTMIQLGLSHDTATLRANTIRLASLSDINNNGVVKASPGSENLGIILAREYFDPDPNKTLVDAIALVSHEAAHASSFQYVEATARQDFGILGSFDQEDPRFGFTGNDKFPNDLLRSLIQLPVGRNLVRAEEFAADTGRVEFMLSLMDLPANIKLILTDKRDVYSRYSVGYSDYFSGAQETMRFKDGRNHLSALTPAKIFEYHRNSDRAGFFLSLGRDIVDNKQTDLSDGDTRALGLVAFTGFLLTSTENEAEKARINEMLDILTQATLTPESIKDTADELVTLM